MDEIRGLDGLRQQGRITWADAEAGWRARPEEIVSALVTDGFQEYKCEEAKSRRDREPAGGMWQGINTQTGAVASAIWAKPTGDEAIVFIDIDGRPLRG